MSTAAWNWKLKLEHQGKKNEKRNSYANRRFVPANKRLQFRPAGSDSDLGMTQKNNVFYFVDRIFSWSRRLWRKVMRKKWNFLSAETWNDLIMIRDAMMTLSGINISNDEARFKVVLLFSGRHEEKAKAEMTNRPESLSNNDPHFAIWKKGIVARSKKSAAGDVFKLSIMSLMSMRISAGKKREAVTIND